MIQKGVETEGCFGAKKKDNLWKMLKNAYWIQQNMAESGKPLIGHLMALILILK